MKINAEGLALLQKSEGCVLHAYRCPAGVLTIGWGHTKDVKEGQVITQHQADEILNSDLDVIYEPGVERLCPDLHENEFSALVCFAYNEGLEALAGSTLLKELRLGHRRTAADEFLKWNKITVNGVHVVSQGLVKRRAAERDLFRKG